MEKINEKIEKINEKFGKIKDFFGKNRTLKSQVVDFVLFSKGFIFSIFANRNFRVENIARIRR